MRNLLKLLLGGCLIALAIWGFFYQYHIWPTPVGEFSWWTMPQTITAAAVALAIGGCGVALIGDVVK